MPEPVHLGDEGAAMNGSAVEITGVAACRSDIGATAGAESQLDDHEVMATARMRTTVSGRPSPQRL